MCYQYAIYSKPEMFEEKWNATFKQEFTPLFHVAAFSDFKLPIITHDKQKEIQLAYWGLIPPWVKKTTQAEEIRLKTANARSETIFEKPSFSHAARYNHCLVLANGFFEWREVDHRKYPYYIKIKNQELFAMAGLWEPWLNPDTKEEIITFTILTTVANPIMAIVHNTKKRMPVILPKNLDRIWLQTFKQEDLKNVLRPIDQNEIMAYTISKRITAKDKDKNVPEVLTPFSYPGVESRFS